MCFLGGAISYCSELLCLGASGGLNFSPKSSPLKFARGTGYPGEPWGAAPPTPYRHFKTLGKNPSKASLVRGKNILRMRFSIVGNVCTPSDIVLVMSRAHPAPTWQKRQRTKRLKR